MSNMEQQFPPACLAAITESNGLVALEMEAASVWVTDARACSHYCSIWQAVE